MLVVMLVSRVKVLCVTVAFWAIFCVSDALTVKYVMPGFL